MATRAYYFRDEQGLEVDYLRPVRNGVLSLVECKAGRTVSPAMAVPMQRLADALRQKRKVPPRVEMCLVHGEPKAGTLTEAVAPGVRAVTWRKFIENL